MDHRNSKREGGDGEDEFHIHITSKVARDADFIVEQDEAETWQQWRIRAQSR